MLVETVKNVPDGRSLVIRVKEVEVVADVIRELKSGGVIEHLPESWIGLEYGGDGGSDHPEGVGGRIVAAASAGHDAKLVVVQVAKVLGQHRL